MTRGSFSRRADRGVCRGAYLCCKAEALEGHWISVQAVPQAKAREAGRRFRDRGETGGREMGIAGPSLGGSDQSAPDDVRPTTIAGHHVGVAESMDTGQLEEWATDAWADAAWDFVEPRDALAPAIQRRSGGAPREVAVATGLRDLGCLNEARVGRLLRSWFERVRTCALSLVVQLEG